MFLIAAVRALHITATVLVAGAVLFDLLVLPGALAAGWEAVVRDPMRQWLRRVCFIAVTLGLLSWCAWVADLAVRMSGLPIAQALQWTVLQTVVTKTTFGAVWTLRALLWIAFSTVLLAWPARWARVVAAVLAVALTASLAWTGHAVGTHASHLVTDAAHLCAAALWVGMLAPLALLTSRASSSGDEEWMAVAALAARRFSLPGLMAVMVLATTGAVNALWLVGSWDNLLTTGYGLQLAAKLVLFAAMLGLAATNRFVLVPGLDKADNGALAIATVRGLQRTVLAEALIGAVLLCVVASLGVTPPPAHEQTGQRGMQHMHPNEDTD